MIKAASSELRKPPMFTFVTNRSAIIIVQAFTIKLNNPKVKRLKGKVSNSRIGFIIRFTTNSTKPMTRSAGVLSICIVSIIKDSRYMVNTIDKYFKNSFDIFTSIRIDITVYYKKRAINYLILISIFTSSVVTSTRS